MLFQDLMTFVFGWLASRRWSSVILFALPLLIVFGGMFGLAIAGWSRSSTQVAKEYFELGERMIAEEKDKAASPSPSEESGDEIVKGGKIPVEAVLAFRRVLKMEDNNRATYQVARFLAYNGDIPTARQMMRKIAPSRDAGYGPAHSWLANERMLRGNFNQASEEEIDVLVRDLQAAVDSNNASRVLIDAYAEILRKLNRNAQAKELLEDSLERYPRLNVTLAMLARAMDDKRTMDRASIAAQGYLLNEIKENPKLVENYRDLTLAYLASGDLEEAARVGNAGLQLAQQVTESTPVTKLKERKLRRALSSAYLEMYLQSKKSSADGKVSVKLAYLDRALAVDPSNSDAVTEVAWVVVQGQTASEDMVQKLQQNLALGNASETTHLLLANYFLNHQDLNQAVGHLEQVLQRNPRHPVALNNLAFALIDQPDKLPRALELIDEALKVTVDSPTQYVSMLDTKGTILARSGDHRAAITCFEDAINMGNSFGVRNPKYHRRLAESYEAVGLTDSAQTQTKIANAIDEEIRKNQANSQPIAPATPKDDAESK